MLAVCLCVCIFLSVSGNIITEKQCNAYNAFAVCCFHVYIVLFSCTHGRITRKYTHAHGGRLVGRCTNVHTNVQNFSHIPSTRRKVRNIYTHGSREPRAGTCTQQLMCWFVCGCVYVCVHHVMLFNCCLETTISYAAAAAMEHSTTRRADYSVVLCTLCWGAYNVLRQCTCTNAEDRCTVALRSVTMRKIIHFDVTHT